MIPRFEDWNKLSWKYPQKHRWIWYRYWLQISHIDGLFVQLFLNTFLLWVCLQILGWIGPSVKYICISNPWMCNGVMEMTYWLFQFQKSFNTSVGLSWDKVRWKLQVFVLINLILAITRTCVTISACLILLVNGTTQLKHTVMKLI